MAAEAITLEPTCRLEDVLSHLPVAGAEDYAKAQIVYGPDRPSDRIYLVVSGKVGLSQVGENGEHVLLEIVRPDELFGETAFLDFARRPDQAEALEKSKLMSWPVSDMETLVMKRPRLALALLQVMAQRSADFARRIESFSLDTIEQRLARSLIRFSERLGAIEEEGVVRMMPFTHEMLSRHVGTSREVITLYMTRFRRQGHLSYSRRGGIVLYLNSLQSILGKKSWFPLAATSS
jgi:CRP/FNR family transcriptional regulator